MKLTISSSISWGKDYEWMGNTGTMNLTLIFWIVVIVADREVVGLCRRRSIVVAWVPFTRCFYPPSNSRSLSARSTPLASSLASHSFNQPSFAIYICHWLVSASFEINTLTLLSICAVVPNGKERKFTTTRSALFALYYTLFPWLTTRHYSSTSLTHASSPTMDSLCAWSRSPHRL